MIPIILLYKGYTAKIKYSTEDKVFYGKIENVEELVTFEADLLNIQKEFHKAVDDYIEFRKGK